MNWAVQVLTVISDYFWLLYLTVVGFFGYKAAGYISDYFMAERQRVAQEDEMRRKAMEKTQGGQQQRGFRQVRR